MNERAAQICQFAHAGHSIADIARFVGCGWGNVARTVKRYGIEVQRITSRSPTDPNAHELNDGLPLRNRDGKYVQFKDQRHAAARRGIEWQLTFAEWVAIWAASGKWAMRGVGSDRYCMARYGDVGPYSVGNVKVILFSDNVREARASDWARRKALKRGGVSADPVVASSVVHAPDGLFFVQNSQP